MCEVFYFASVIFLQNVIIGRKTKFSLFKKLWRRKTSQLCLCYNASNLMNFVFAMILCDSGNHCSSGKLARASHNEVSKSKTGILKVCARFALVFSPNRVGIIKYQAIKPSHTILTPQRIMLWLEGTRNVFLLDLRSIPHVARIELIASILP